MSTSEAQVIARALFDSLVTTTQSALRSAAERAAGNGRAARVEDIVGADAPTHVRNLVAVLARDGKLSDLPAVARAFESYTASMQETTLSAEVVSAEALSAEQQARISEQLRASHGQRLELRFSVDPSIIGGLIIRIGDQVLDNSVRTRLSAVQRSMLTS